MTDFVSRANELVEDYMAKDEGATPTQEILDAGEIPRLKDYTVRPGKVSDCIHGGKGKYFDKKAGHDVQYENPPLLGPDGEPVILMVRSLRISTHDKNRGEIPFKDQILALNHNYMRRLVGSVMPGCQYEVGLPDNSVVIAAEQLEPILFENVIRAYNAKSSTSTSLYQAWKRGDVTFCGHKMPEGLVANGPLPYIMVTPSTKDENDISVSPGHLFTEKICTPGQFNEITSNALVAFGVVTQHLRQKGLVLVDTKTEHGVNQKGQIRVMDELYTMDSSRFWSRDEMMIQLKGLRRGEIDEIKPKSFSKEFARGYSKGDEGYTDEQRAAIATRYVLGIEFLLDRPFEPDMRPWNERVVEGLEASVNALVN